MAFRVIVTPDDTLWWLLRPEFIAFVDGIVMSREQFQHEEELQEKSGFHKVTWRRLSVLMDEGFVDLRDLALNSSELSQQATALIQDLLDRSESAEKVTRDLIFAYNYWISFNRQKLELLPTDQQYATTIDSLLPKWEEDRDCLEKSGMEALRTRPPIRDVVFHNILQKVLAMRTLHERHQDCPMLALKQYEPFLKYVESGADVPTFNETSRITFESTLPAMANGQIHLPAEPEFDFMRLRLSRLRFRDLLKAMRSNYRHTRQQVHRLTSIADDIAYGLGEGGISGEYTTDFYRLNQEFLDSQRARVKRSKYLAGAFFGLSLIPIPPLSALFGVLGLGASKVSEIIESITWERRGVSPAGSSAYFSFLESIMDVRHLGTFPDVKAENAKVFMGDKPFWRD